MSMVLVIGLLASGCRPPAEPRSYLALPLLADGRPHRLPYVVHGTICGVPVVAVGTVHDRNPVNPQFAELEALYRRFRPALVLHENVTPASAAPDRDSAIRRDGEIGLMRFLTAHSGVLFRSADLPEAEEFRALAAESAPLALLVFLTGQRLLTGQSEERVAAAEYPDFYQAYLVGNGFPGRDAWSTWVGFRAAYREIVGTDYHPSTFDPDLFSPIRARGALNEIARRGHRLRDAHLMRQLRAAAEGQARIMLVFGAWHVLALEPVIRAGSAALRHPRLPIVHCHDGWRGLLCTKSLPRQPDSG